MALPKPESQDSGTQSWSRGFSKKTKNNYSCPSNAICSWSWLATIFDRCDHDLNFFVMIYIIPKIKKGIAKCLPPLFQPDFFPLKNTLNCVVFRSVLYTKKYLYYYKLEWLNLFRFNSIERCIFDVKISVVHKYYFIGWTWIVLKKVQFQSSFTNASNCENNVQSNLVMDNNYISMMMPVRENT